MSQFDLLYFDLRQMVQILAETDSSFSSHVKRCFCAKKERQPCVLHSVIRSTHMHSTQLTEVAPNLIGQRGRDREESGLMAEQTGKDNELITACRKNKNEQKLVLESN